MSHLFLTNHWVEFNKILHEASIPRGDVHTLQVLQLHVILQSYGPFVGRSEAIFWIKVLFWGYLSSSMIVLVSILFNNYSFIYRVFLFIFLDVFKVICWKYHIYIYVVEFTVHYFRCPFCDYGAIMDPGNKVFTCMNEKCRRVCINPPFPLKTKLQPTCKQNCGSPIKENIMVEKSRKHFGKVINCSSWVNSPFGRVFSKVVWYWCIKMCLHMGKC